VTTEEIIARLDRVYYYLSCDKLDKAAIRAAIERLRGDEWPRVFEDECGDYRVYDKNGDGDLYLKTGLRIGVTGRRMSLSIRIDKELTGPARAEVMERLGIKEAGQ
jgi:hypothetical protein